ncbi:MAG TPA: GldG family protein [Polyangia bacterium]|nr:GldG family protein [Polyangia bacterium]
MATAPSKAKTGANAIVFLVLVILGVVAVNVIAARFGKRIDLTQDHVYTLSPASKDLVAKLPDVLQVKAFISGDLQPPFSQTAQYVRDLLDEYAHASKGKLKWEAIDPGEDSKLEEEATKMKVPKMRRGRISNNKVEIGASYLGIALSYQGNVESIPEVNSPEGLEFEIDKRVRMLTQKKTKIAFATSEGELQTTGGQQQGQGGGLQALKQYMDFFEAVPTDLKGKQIPDDVAALVIAGPKQPFTDRAKFVIDQFLMKGKSVAFFVDGMTFETPQQMQMPGQAAPPQIGRKNDTGLDDLLGHYGLKINDDVILEPQKNAPGPLMVDGQMQLGNYPTFMVTDSIAKSSPLFEHVDALIVPFASSVELLKDNKAQAGLVYTQLAQSSGQAWRQKGFFVLNPTVPLKPGDDKGPFSLGYTVEGKFKSFYAGKPFPNEKGEKTTLPANASLPPDAEKPIDASEAPGRLFVFGSANVVSDLYVAGVSRYVPVYQIDLAFDLNVMDWLAQDKAMSSIRAKAITQRPVTVSSDTTPIVLQAINIVGVPLLFILFGVMRWRLRSARRARAKL